MLAGLTLLAAVTAAAAPPDPRQADLVALFDQLCLHAFPDDAALGRAVTARGATPLSAADVKVTLGADPGRGWRLQGAGRIVSVWLDLPPFHACSVRFSAPPDGGEVPAFGALVRGYAAAHPGFARQPAFEGDQGAIHVRIRQDVRPVPPAGSESLMQVDQHVTDPARRARGETGISRRFVRQIADKRE